VESSFIEELPEEEHKVEADGQMEQLNLVVPGSPIPRLDSHSVQIESTRELLVFEYRADNGGGVTSFRW